METRNILLKQLIQRSGKFLKEHVNIWIENEKYTYRNEWIKQLQKSIEAFKQKKRSIRNSISNSNSISTVFCLKPY
jgi:hypothetical protein